MISSKTKKRVTWHALPISPNHCHLTPLRATLQALIKRHRSINLSIPSNTPAGDGASNVIGHTNKRAGEKSVLYRLCCDHAIPKPLQWTFPLRTVRLEELTEL